MDEKHDENDQKRLRKVISRLPYDCWGIIALFLGGYPEFRILLLAVPGMFDYVKNINSYCARNLFFKASKFPKQGLNLRYVRNVVVGESRVFSRRIYGKQLETSYQARIANNIINSTKTSIFNKILNACPDLQSIQVCCQDFNNRTNTVIDVGKRCPSEKFVYPLRKISIGHSREFTLNVYFEHFPNLDSLTLEWKQKFEKEPRNWFQRSSGCFDIEFYVFGSEEHLPKLKEIKIVQIRSLIMNPIFFEHLRKNSLKILHIEDSKINSLEKIVDFPFLESLTLILNESKFVISNLPRLAKLHVEVNEYSRVTLGGRMINMLEIDCSTVLKNLKELSLKNVLIEPKNLTFLSLEKIEKIFLEVFDEYIFSHPFGQGIEYLRYRLEHLLSSSESSSSCKLLKSLSVSSRFAPVQVDYLPTSGGLKNLELLLGPSDIIINIDELRTSVEVLKIAPCEDHTYMYHTPRMCLNYPRGCIRVPDDESNKSNKHQHYTTKKMHLSQFLRLKEIYLGHLSQDVEHIRIDKCNQLKKITFEYTLANGYNESGEKRKVEISDLPNLTSLVIRSLWIASHLKVVKCPKISRLALEDCLSFPAGISRNKLTELEIKSCSSSAIPNQTIDGGTLFTQLKYLSIKQSYLHAVGTATTHLEKERQIAVKRLKNLGALWKLEIESNFIQECGIVEVMGLSEHVDVVLRYKRGIFREDSVVKTMDKKRFIQFFNKLMDEKKNSEDDEKKDSSYVMPGGRKKPKRRYRRR